MALTDPQSPLLFIATITVCIAYLLELTERLVSRAAVSGKSVTPAECLVVGAEAAARLLVLRIIDRTPVAGKIVSPRIGALAFTTLVPPLTGIYDYP